jgi:hypothetical protein
MSDTTTLLNLPYIMPSQAQKHVTHNEALRALDAILHIRVEDRGLNEPPATPSEGERHLLGSAPTGSFAGQAGKIAAFQDGAWFFHSPRPGWLVWDAADGALIVFDGIEWHPAFDPQNLPFIGINATADETNRLAVAAPATLLTHEGAGHQLKIDKAAAGDTASLLFQTAWSGRAEMGLAGNDDFSIKVSPDGGAWHTALSADRATGRVTTTALAIAAAGEGESGLKFGNLNAASAPVAPNNRTLSLNDDGDVVLSKAGFPVYTMNGVDSDTGIVRDFNAQVAKGTGLYIGDNGGHIDNSPIPDWVVYSFTGVSAGFFGQFAFGSSDAFFRGAQVGDVGSAAWYILMKQEGATDGYVPYYYQQGNTKKCYLNSLLFQGDGGMGIGTAAPNASALLDLASTARGFLPPRMTTPERDAIASPAEGLVIYNLTDHEPQFWNRSAWVGMAAG